MTTCAILLCAGAGVRFGELQPKQFAMLRGQPLFIHSLRRLCAAVAHVHICINEADREYVRAYLDAAALPNVTLAATGGRFRHESIYQTLVQLNANAEDIVVIHDAARPYPNVELVHTLVHEAKTHGGAIATRPCSSTIVERTEDNFLGQTVERERHVESHTPQAFRFGPLLAGYTGRLPITNLRHGTECAALFPGRVKLVLADAHVFKVTYKTDLLLAQQLWPGGVAVVTGGGRGIGRRVAQLLAERGITVIVCARTRSEIDLVAAETGGMAVECDVSDPQAVRAMFLAVRERYGRVDILVNNAGALRLASIADTDTATLQAVFDVNALGTFACTREAAPLMQPRGGVIVSIGSSSTQGGRCNQAAYAMSKAAAQLLADIVPLEYPNIACYNIVPRRTDTRMRREAFGTDDGDALTVDDVARAVCIPVFHFMQCASGNHILLR